MKIVTLDDAPKVPFNIEGYIMHTSPSMEVIHLCLHPGQEISQHTNPFNVVVSLIKGDAMLVTGEKSIRLTLYDTVDIEKNINRGFENCGKEEARLLLIKRF